MPKLSLTTRQINYIKAHRMKESGAAMARKFGVSKDVVGRYMRNTGLDVPADLKIKFRAEGLLNKTSSDRKTDNFIRKNYLTMPVKTMATKLNRSHCFVNTRLRQLNLVIPADIIAQRKMESRFKKGQECHNKGKKMAPEIYEKVKNTMFKKGNKTHNTYPSDGIITTRMDNLGHPYKFIRVSLGKWQLLHKYNYEQKHGKVPVGHCLWFIDGNSLNCEDANIELITRAENARRNRQKFLQLPDELKTTIRIVKKIKTKIRENEHKKQTVRP